ncbi:MAG: amidohydrolase family protein [Candidatus Latescibacterota bacterium]|nr:amidohydrolase family protein [Candidatus Latescibacterota bacterium]
MAYRSEWLAQVAEEILEPERPIVDPHHHFWTESSWGRYMLDDLWADTSAGHRVEKTVFLECRSQYLTDGPEHLRPVGETRFVAGLATEADTGPALNARVGAIIGHANLLLGKQAREVLTAHMEASPLFRGIRHSASWDLELSGPSAATDAHRYLDETFREGFACLGDLGLSFDAWMFHPQLPELADLARAFPDTTIILNHLGGPLGAGSYAENRDEVIDQWQHNLTEVSECPNVVVKVGGIAMPLNGFGWHERNLPPGSEELADADRPFCEFAIQAFGADRCMFESNFPVDKIGVSYPVLWNAFKRIVENYSETDKEALFRGTATRVYRL